MLEYHIMQAQVRSTSADVGAARRLYSDILSTHPDVFIPPGTARYLMTFSAHFAVCGLHYSLPTKTDRGKQG